MPDFMFRNLSVKLNSADDELGRYACVDRTTQLVLVCSPCTHLCTGTYTPCDHTCYNSPPTNPIYCPDRSTTMSYCDPTSAHQCDSTSQWRSHVNALMQVIIEPGTDILQEIAAIRVDLQRKMAAVDALEQEVQNAAKPKSVQEIDELKSQLLATIAELDDQRAQMQGGQAEGGQAPPAS
jgi:hypothetical protein